MAEVVDDARNPEDRGRPQPLPKMRRTGLNPGFWIFLKVEGGLGMGSDSGYGTPLGRSLRALSSDAALLGSNVAPPGAFWANHKGGGFRRPRKTAGRTRSAMGGEDGHTRT